MKIEESLIKQIKVSDVERLDPVTIIVEEVGKDKAHVTIKCCDKSWTSYWGGMGGSVKDFFSRTNVHYLVNCFDRGIRSESEEIDYEEMKETFSKKIRDRILKERRDNYLTKDSARELWDQVEDVDFTDIVPEHDHESFSWKLNTYSMEHSIWRLLFWYESELLGESEEFQQWLWDNVPFVYEKNHEYYYLCRVVEVVKKVLMCRVMV